MAIGSQIIISPFTSTPSPPTTGFLSFFVEGTTIYLQDSSGNLYAFGSTTAITSLTGDVTATGPGAAVATLTNSAVTGQLLTGYTVGGNVAIAATDSILTAFEKVQGQLNSSSASAITALTGDVSASGPGSATATVNSVGGSSAANVHSAELAANAATSVNTASTIVKRDASGNFSANIITAALNGNASTSSSFTGSLSGDVTGTQSATVVQAIQGTSVSSSTPTDGQILIFNSTPDKYAPQTISSDVSITNVGVATVNSIGGSSAADVHSAELAANAATNSNAASTIVKRDSSGNFSAGTITANLTGLASNATTSVSFTGSLSGDVTGTQSATSISSTTVTGKLLTGYTIGSNVAIAATDSILGAFEKVQGQLNATSSAAITALTGDVSASGPGSATATVNSVGGASASSIASTVSTVAAATSSNTPSTIVERDASGNFSAGTITASLSGNATSATTATTATNFTGSLSGDVTGTQSATSISSATVTGKLLTGYTTGTNTPIIATNSILTAFENLQAQVTASTGAAITALTGDGTATGPGSATFTLATVNTNTGSFGSSTSIPSFTVNGKGLITAASSNVVVAPAGTLTGTTLNLTVVSSSLTSVGTIISGVWNGTALTAPYMLPLATNDIYVGNGSNQPAAVAMSGDISIISSGATTVQKIQGTVVSGVTGTGNVVMSASPTLTSTITAAAATFSGSLASTLSSTTALTLNTTSFVFDTTNNALGIGVQPSTAVMVDGVNTSGASKLIQMTGYGVGSTTGYRGRFARGTLGSPTAVQSGDILSAISGRGYGTSQFPSASTGVMNIVAGETFTNTSNLTYLQFSTTPTGSVTSAEAMRVASTGVTLGPQSTSTAIHQINGGIYRTVRTITGNLTVDTTQTDDVILCNHSAPITITMPVPTQGRVITIVDISGAAQTNAITIAQHASETIEGLAASKVYQTNWGSLVFIAGPSGNWWSI